MPVIVDSNLPTYRVLLSRGHRLISKSVAQAQDIRELHIGILNIMPDAALEATERQFVQLLNASSTVAQIQVHFFTLDSVGRSEKYLAHIGQHYRSFDELREEGLDALILTGTNWADADLAQAPFWNAFCTVLEWAEANVSSTLCACLATHAAFKYLFGGERHRLPTKLWGVFDHVQCNITHPLLSWMNTRFRVPHSRWNDISEEQFVEHNCKVLVRSDVAGVHVATSPDGFRFVFLQGHPEYDTISLLKEFKREVRRFHEGAVAEFPPVPLNYFSDVAIEEIMRFRQPESSKDSFPEGILATLVENDWRDSARSFFYNWIGGIYHIAHFDRVKQYADGVDRSDPLGLAQSGSAKMRVRD
ncbi:MAG: homoserine O-succinyltransferase [Myxococcales bacterium]|nr:homoserine O-succinyltransferase [Myxococcales bacterium]